MAFLESPIFPYCVSFGAIGGAGYQTDVVIMSSGRESRNQGWDQPRGRWEVSHAARTPEGYIPLRALFRAAKGRAHGFRFQDHTDYTVSLAEGVLGTGVGAGIPTSQLAKKYSYGVLAEYRNIVKPSLTSLPEVYKNGALAVEGGSPGNYAIDLSTGIITWVATSTKTITGITKANPGVVTASSHGFTNGMTIYIAAAAGMTQVNNLAFVIANVAANTFDLPIDTTNYTTYTGSGTASIYPQPSDSLTWTGEFDVPVRFDTDEMRAETINKSPQTGEFLIGWSSIPLLEIRFP